MLKRLLFVVLLALASAAQAVVYSLPWGPKPQFVDANGAPMVSGTLLTFVGGSSTPQVTYTDSTGGTSNPTTITLNSRGETPNEVWLTGGVTYKFVLKDSGGTTIWTVDGVTGVNDTSSSFDQWVVGATPTFVSATSFTLAGDQTSIYHIGRRLKSTNSGGTVYSTISASTFGASTTVTVQNDAGTSLDSGLSAVSYALLSSINPSLPNRGVVSPAQITSNQNDYNPSNLNAASILRLSTDASRNITSIAGGAGGRQLKILNVGAFPLVLKVDDGATGTAANRFSLDQDVVLQGEQSAVLVYDATTSRWRLQSGPPKPGVIATGRNIASRTNSGAATTTIDITADELLLKDTNGGTLLARTVSVSPAITSSGANGLDTGVEASNTWYYGWAIAKPDGTVAGLISASSSAPTMPSGYTFKALVAAVRNNGSSNFVAYRQLGSEVFYEVQQSALSTATYPTSETTLSLSSFVPPIAQRFSLNHFGALGASGGTGDTTLRTRIVTGSIYAQIRVRCVASTECSWGSAIEYPNVSQQVIYDWSSVVNIAAVTYDIAVLGFKLPVGGQ